MGLIVNVYRDSLGDCTLNGVSSKAETLCVINVDGPFEPTPDTPAVKLVRKDFGFGSSIRLVPVDANGDPLEGVMLGGNHAGTSDSRFARALSALMGGDNFGLRAVPIFDRIER